jgi:hypothetical protein
MHSDNNQFPLDENPSFKIGDIVRCDESTLASRLVTGFLYDIVSVKGDIIAVTYPGWSEPIYGLPASKFSINTKRKTNT